MRLWPIQSAALLEMEAANGGLFPVGAGHGKTIVSLLAGEVLEAKTVLLLVPPGLKDQLLRIDIPRYLEAFRFRVPHVLSYVDIQTEKGRNLLLELQPDLIVADEAHNLKRKESVRTKRVINYFRKFPATRLVALSGTFTSRSLREYAHLAELALRERSPVPRSWGVLEDWCAALDPDVLVPVKAGALERLCVAHDHPVLRERYRCRLVSSPGVVATEESAIGTSLIVARRAPKEFPESVSCALDALRKTWTRPDGEEIEEATRFAQVASQIAQGFYLKWEWPEGKVDHEWLSARSEWHREMRAYLSNRSAPGRDSPLLVARMAEREPEAFRTWGRWAAVKDRKPPPTSVVWLDPYLAADAATWLKDGGIVWVNHPCMGEKIAELSGLPFFGAGDDQILRYEGPGMVASTSAHGTGKNLQRWARMLFTHVPGALALEQAIARCHRPGQLADEVLVNLYLHTEELEKRWMKSLEEAQYIQETTGQRQKVLLATLVGFSTCTKSYPKSSTHG